MYRAYENPYKIERLLEEAKSEYENALLYNADNEELLFEIAQEIHELENRLNFAWQDDEAEIEGYDY